MKPKVSIIVPAYNEEKTLCMCLDSLMSLNFSKHDFEVVVVDNNSTDGTKNIITSYPVKYIFEGKRSRGAARNKGVKESQGELLAFIDADCVADKDWLLNITKGFTSKEIGGCGGKVLAYEPRSLIEKYIDYRGMYSQEECITNKKTLLPRIITANAAYPRRIVEEVGLFDSRFASQEDIDLAWRVFLKGYKLAYIPEAMVYHRHRKTLVDAVRQCFERGQFSIYLQQKYINLGKMPFFICYNSNNFFLEQFKALISFPRAMFKGKDLLAKTLPLLDMIRNTTFLLGRICTLLKPRWRPTPIPKSAFVGVLKRILLQTNI